MPDTEPQGDDHGIAYGRPPEGQTLPYGHDEGVHGQPDDEYDEQMGELFEAGVSCEL